MVVWKGGNYSLQFQVVDSNRLSLEPATPPEQGELYTSIPLHSPCSTVLYSLQLVVQPVSDSILEQLNKLSPPSAAATHLHPHILEDLGLGLMEGEGTREEPHEPSPFSTKRDMYSGKSGAQVFNVSPKLYGSLLKFNVWYLWLKFKLMKSPAAKHTVCGNCHVNERVSVGHSLDLCVQSPEEEGGGPQEHTEQLVTPGTRSEMEEFEQYSSSLARYHLNLHLPRVFVHLPSKSFLQTLYCR